MALERQFTFADTVQQTINSQIETDDGLSDLWKGLRWRLARDPLTDVYRVPESEPPTYVARVSHPRTAAAIVVIYQFDATRVHVSDLYVDLAAAAAPAPE